MGLSISLVPSIDRYQSRPLTGAIPIKLCFQIAISTNKGGVLLIRQFIYMSSAVTLLTDEELQDLVRVARANNELNGITGMLIYAEGSFLQVLEGSYLDVEARLERISNDARHSRITMLLDHWVPAREFGASLDFQATTERLIDEISGAKRFFNYPTGAGARKALAVFRRGENASAGNIEGMADAMDDALLV